MGKPTWVMLPPKLTAIDSFVAEGAEPQTPKRLDAQTSKATVQRKDGRELRRMTVYLPADLAAKVRVHCAGLDQDVSEFIGEAVAGRLNA